MVRSRFGEFAIPMAKDGKLRIVMFPWLAFGHLIPYLQFAKLIAQKGHHVFFVSTPRNIDRLPKIPHDLAPFISFVKLTLPRVDNLPEDAEATIDVPHNMVKYLKIAYDGLRTRMTEFLQSSDPDWILHDFASYWLGPIAVQLCIKTALFSIFNPEALGLLGPVAVLKGVDNRKTPEDFTATPTWIPFTTAVSFQYFDMDKILKAIEESDQGVSDFYRIAEVVATCDIVASRGSYEFQPEWFRLLNNIYQKPVFAVGHFPTTECDVGEEAETWGFIKSWLDKQVIGSVVYIAFGSEVKPTQAELTEIALGLEQSELPFIWVLINRRGLADSEVIELPEGFEVRTKGRGLVFTSWAPQLKILAHDSVGGFLTHSGSSSIVEGIQFEVAFISLSFSAGQGINATVLAEKKLGHMIPRDKYDGSFTRNAVAESLRLVMIEEEGKIYRENVKKIRGLVVDRDRQESYVINFLEYLHKNSCKKLLHGGLET